MALNSATLSAQIETAFIANLPAPSATQAGQIHTLSDSIANAILAFVESATITYTAGLVAPPGGGPVSGVFTGTLS